MRWSNAAAAAMFITAVSGGASALSAQAIINNGTIQVGVDSRGQLNVPGGSLSSGGSTTTVGLRYMPTNAASTEPGCVCEGWGAGVFGVTDGYANNSAGISNVSVSSFTGVTGGSTATSVTTIGGMLEVTHQFFPSPATANLYEVRVTLRNLTAGTLGTNANDIRYTRVMDWDIEPTPFAELVTLGGWGATNLLSMGTNGFQSGSIYNTGQSYCIPGTSNTNVYRAGPCDHGAEFYFGFDPLAAGASQSFSIFYGAAGNEAAIMGALGAAGAEVYSLGYCNTSACSADGSPNVFAFGFAGVGGEALPDTTVPEPMTMVLFGTGLAGIGVARRRRAAAKA
jgi:hypothetical protein